VHHFTDRSYKGSHLGHFFSNGALNLAKEA